MADAQTKTEHKELEGLLRKGDYDAFAAKVNENHVKIRDSNASTLLHLAAKTRNEKFAKKLVELGADVNGKTRDEGKTPFYLACAEGNEIVVPYLLTVPGIDISICDDDGRSPFYVACKFGFDRVVSLLISNPKINLNEKYINNWTALSAAALDGKDKVVSLLLDRPEVDVNSKNVVGWTALSAAASSGHDEVVSLLLSNKNVDVHVKDRDGKTPLCLATEKGQEMVVYKLLFYPGILDLTGEDNVNPLHLAISGKTLCGDMSDIIMLHPRVDPKPILEWAKEKDLSDAVSTLENRIKTGKTLAVIRISQLRNRN